MAELIQTVFSPKTDPTDRRSAAQELTYALRTTWRGEAAAATGEREENLFPSSILAETDRGYLVAIGRQMNGAFAIALYDVAGRHDATSPGDLDNRGF